MPRLSLYRNTKQNDYNFFDKIILEQFIAGGTDLYVHKYLGPQDQGPSIDYTQPQYQNTDPTNIQDLLFLENRDRAYDTNIYRLRGHYNVQNLDFDLSQFGLFLNNDIIFITVHYNNMIDLIGRKLMVGDVIELPHLLDYNPLKETIPTALKRFYQITDANFASEGFSQTWYPHLWRIKCEPLVNTQEFSQILDQPNNTDNYLGQYDSTKTYPPGYVITFGDKNYVSIADVPIGVTPPNDTYWKLDDNQTLKDILSTYNKNIEINNALLDEAKRLVPLSGYDNSNLYIVPTYGPESDKFNQPAPPVNVVVNNGAPVIATVSMITSSQYKTASPVLRIPKNNINDIWNMTIDSNSLKTGSTIELTAIQTAPTLTGSGSGPVTGDVYLSAYSMGPITGPYGTSDNTYATSDQDPTLPNFTGKVTQQMDYRADCDPRFQFITRISPRSFGYAAGYLTGTGAAPNGIPAGVGISFPQNPSLGDYFLRIDYYPQLLFRWDGNIWVRISSNVRTDTGFTNDDKSQLSSFINNNNNLIATDGSLIPEKQALSTILTINPKPIPPVI